MSWMRNIFVLGQPCSSAKVQPLLGQQSRQGALQPLEALLRSKPEPLSLCPWQKLLGNLVGAQQDCMAHLHPLPLQEQNKGRSNTELIGDLGTAAVGSSAPARISMLTRPSATSTWRLSSAASMPQVSAPGVLSSSQALGDRRDPAAHHHISGTSLCQSTLPVRLALSLWLHPGGSSENGFSAIKLTALGRPQFLVSARAVTRVRGVRAAGNASAGAGALGCQACCSGISTDGREEWAPTGCPLCAQDHPGDPASTSGDAQRAQKFKGPNMRVRGGLYC